MSAPSFALVAGLLYIGAGALGFAGFFPVAKLLAAVYLIVGLWGGAAWAGATGAVGYARSIAILFGALALVALALLALFPAPSAVPALVTLGGRAFWLHTATALIAGYFGFRSMARHLQPADRQSPMERRRKAPSDRRRASRPVAHDHRRGIADRRFGGALASGF